MMTRVRVCGRRGLMGGCDSADNRPDTFGPAVRCEASRCGPKPRRPERPTPIRAMTSDPSSAPRLLTLQSSRRFNLSRPQNRPRANYIRIARSPVEFLTRPNVKAVALPNPFLSIDLLWTVPLVSRQFIVTPFRTLLSFPSFPSPFFTLQYHRPPTATSGDLAAPHVC